MLMRLAMLLSAAILATCAVAQPTDVGVAVSSPAPNLTITRSAGVHACQELTVPLQQGENRLFLDVAALETDPATLRVRLLDPVGQARVTSVTTGPQPGQVVASINADQAVTGKLRLSYEVGYVQADVSYSLLLDPTRQKLTVQADLTVRNNSKHEFNQTKLTLPQGRQATLNLRPGETVQQQLFALPDVPYEISYLYDNSRFKDAVRTLLTIPAEARANAPLPAGKARIFAPGAGGTRTLIAEAGLPYLPASEKVELDLGAAPDLSVLRTRLRSDQVNVRSDVYHKLALFDLDEEYELEVSNRRATPIVLIVREHVPGDWQLGKSSVPAAQTDSGTLEFTVRTEAGAKQKLSYSVKRLSVEP